MKTEPWQVLMQGPTVSMCQGAGRLRHSDSREACLGPQRSLACRCVRGARPCHLTCSPHIGKSMLPLWQGPWGERGHMEYFQQ